jgi:hypothetical protein
MVIKYIRSQKCAKVNTHMLTLYEFPSNMHNFFIGVRILEPEWKTIKEKF